MTDWEHLPWLYRLIDNTVNLFFSSVYSRYIRTLGLTGTERVLDFGSGSGIGARHLAALLKRGGHLTCVDTSRSLTAKARRRLRRYPNVDFRVGELPALALPGGSYQVVFIHYVLHELAPATRSAYVKEFARLLAPSGRLFFKEPTGGREGIPAAELKSLLTGAGFTEVSFTPGNVATGVYAKLNQGQ